MTEKEMTVFAFLFGGTGYGLIEILYRGYTHWSMIITGGFALVSLFLIETTFESSPLYIKALAGSTVITALEFTAGIIVNIIFSMGVWDYSGLTINILGQISLPSSLCWFAASLAVFYIFKKIKPVILRLKA